MKVKIIIFIMTIISCYSNKLFPNLFRSNHFFEFNMYTYRVSDYKYFISDNNINYFELNILKDHIIPPNLYRSDRYTIDDSLNIKIINYLYSKNLIDNLPKYFKIEYLKNDTEKITHVTKIY